MRWIGYQPKHRATVEARPQRLCRVAGKAMTQTATTINSLLLPGAIRRNEEATLASSFASFIPKRSERGL
jgi:hypothetical protein